MDAIGGQMPTLDESTLQEAASAANAKQRKKTRSYQMLAETAPAGQTVPAVLKRRTLNPVVMY
jgi:hypothetical protein